jgi:hypothetical protein
VAQKQLFISFVPTESLAHLQVFAVASEAGWTRLEVLTLPYFRVGF